MGVGDWDQGQWSGSDISTCMRSHLLCKIVQYFSVRIIQSHLNT